MSITPVILCGGSGTRLWPVSRKSMPKQFTRLTGDKSLLELTLERVAPLAEQLICIASEEHRFLALEAIERVQPPRAVDLVLEPVGRNTAAAVALAVCVAQSRDVEADPLLLFVPSDHFIPDAAAFRQTVLEGRAAAEAGAIVTFGIVPTSPSSAYGYIRARGAHQGASLRVERFIEKPDRARAEQLLLEGDVYWNAGIFLARASTWRRALEAHAADIWMSVEQAHRAGSQEDAPRNGAKAPIRTLRPQKDGFAATRAQSIDYAVMEHFADVAMVPFAGQWSDVGSWSAVAELAPADEHGNAKHGRAYFIGARNTYVHAPERVVAAIGTEDLLIIDTPDALLVLKRDQAERVREAVALLEGDNVLQATMHRRVARPWGWYDSLDFGERFQVKRIGVKPGASLSLQMHHHRAEHWIVVRGTAEVTCGDKTFLLTENQSTYIPLGEVHRLANPGKVELEIIEVQSGSYLGEDDIVRLEDIYGRAKQKLLNEAAR
ncbi:MAG: mannose-1-phosphate guanylyltransferase/mannose-6-phosphate isomerase [Casimicrobiaceae bacterium]|nr:mannose-1-phosphate guanylyltransferase/mannose-6-phosphate isomerase [Casimicrobiaceae bacterium]